MEVRRLTGQDAAAITDCFRRVYGESYGNDLFYQETALTTLLKEGQVCSVGAFDGKKMIGHMAMSIRGTSWTPELGNTVVDPDYRGAGIAWKVGAELTSWCRERYVGFLHFPTTEHHIMQAQAAKDGYETGLMLSYIPAETDGKVNAGRDQLRQAATVVYQPLRDADAQTIFAPDYFNVQILEMAAAAGLQREYATGVHAKPANNSQTKIESYPKRSIERLTVITIGADLGAELQDFVQTPCACWQLDINMGDANLAEGIKLARQAGFIFAGWLPGYMDSDVIRLQRFELGQTNMNPDLVNATAIDLHKAILEELRRDGVMSYDK